MNQFWNSVALILKSVAWLGFVAVVGFTIYVTAAVLIDWLQSIDWAKDNDFWLYRWQTLIAGLLAVVAATGTIYMMARTDSEQQRRHDDLLGLNLRSDRLRIRRATTPTVGELRWALNETTTLLNDLESMANPNFDFLDKLAEAFKAIDRAVDRNEIEQAKDLFDAFLYSLTSGVQTGAGEIRNGIASIEGVSGWQINIHSHEKTRVIRHDRVPDLIRAQEIFTKFKPTFEQFGMELAKLQNAYDRYAFE